MEKKKFVGFGEMLLRMSPDGYLRFAQADRFNLSYSGAEGNMAIALSYMGMPTELVTKLPDNDIGRCARRVLNKYGVNTSHIAWGGERLGIYYLERGASQRPSKVIYDRKHSSISEAAPEDFDWDEIFADAGWFHFTGITAALSPNTQALCREACIAAKRHNVKVSCDLNYRKSLWSTEEAQRVMKPMMEYVDVLIANEEDSEKALGIKASDTDVTRGQLSIDGYTALAKKLTAEYGFEAVAVTLRESISASVNNWSALLYTDGQSFTSKKYNMYIVDRVGGGDSFASGLIYGYLNGFDRQKALEFAVGASCLKHSIEYDFNLSTPEEVMTLINGDGSGRVVR
ncbi:MAG: 2-dehydro-3-deoxygluconokinase [Clostridia bacterium]|nr:MAG: 2-dehydro-3-deoxygluconokinase [Clostridia bacterium]